MNRKQQPKQEQFCEEDWNNVSTIDSEAYWVSKVRSSCQAHDTCLQLCIAADARNMS